MNRPLIPMIIVAALYVACADGTLPPRSASDPANPNALETPTDREAGPPAPSPADVAEGGEGRPTAHEHHHAAPPASSGGAP
jgi:hypothetical protein